MYLEMSAEANGTGRAAGCFWPPVLPSMGQVQAEILAALYSCPFAPNKESLTSHSTEGKRRWVKGEGKEVSVL
jgi:hypothetical protein